MAIDIQDRENGIFVQYEDGFSRKLSKPQPNIESTLTAIWYKYDITPPIPTPMNFTSTLKGLKLS